MKLAALMPNGNYVKRNNNGYDEKIGVLGFDNLKGLGLECCYLNGLGRLIKLMASV